MLKIKDPLKNSGRLILSMHPAENGQEDYYDLLVLSTEMNEDRQFAIRLSDLLLYYEANINEGVERALYNALYDHQFELYWFIPITPGTMPRRLDSYLKIIMQLARRVNFNVIFAPMLALELTSQDCISDPSSGVSFSKTGNIISTAGIFTTDQRGRIGVTAALHGVVDDPDTLVELYNEKGAGCVLGKEVFINGSPGIIRSADLITDSCFIELAEVPSINTKAVKGPLRDRPPFMTEPVFFDGVTSGRVDTNITDIDIKIPPSSRNTQATIYTKPVTNRGDSGAALLNGQDEVLGFNHGRTGYNAPVEFAAWIWADSVYNALYL